MKAKHRKIRRIVNIFLWLSVATLSSTSFLYGKNISYLEQLALYEGLRTTSSIILGVSGAWLAILYPGELAECLKEHKTASSHIVPIITTITSSVLILAAISLIQFVAPVLKQFQFNEDIISVFKGLSFSLIFFLTCIQIKSMLLILLPSYLLQRSIKEIEEEEKFKRHIIGKK